MNGVCASSYLVEHHAMVYDIELGATEGAEKVALSKLKMIRKLFEDDFSVASAAGILVTREAVRGLERKSNFSAH